MTGPKECPFCGSEVLGSFRSEEGLNLACLACGGAGPTGRSEDKAIRKWNMRAGGKK